MRVTSGAGAVPAGEQDAGGHVGVPRDVVVAAGLSLVAVIAHGRYALSAGFVYDDWAEVANNVFSGREPLSYRPVATLLTWAAVGAFGRNPTAYYIWTLVLFALIPPMLYLTLRRLNAGPIGGAIAALTFTVCPFADSLHLWWSASGLSLAIILGLMSVQTGAAWHRSGSSTALICSELLIAASVLTYQSGALIAALPVALVALSPKPRRTISKFVLDIAAAGTAVVAASLVFGIPPAQAVGSPTTYLQRVADLTREGFNVFIRHSMTHIGTRHLIVGSIGAALTLLVTLYWYRRSASTPEVDSRWPIGWGELLAAGAMLVAMFASWLPLVPANNWYSPGLLGIGNRVNAVPQLFFSGAVGLACSSLMPRLGVRRAWARLSPALGALVALTLLSAFVDQSLHDSRDWTVAAERRADLVGVVHAVIPRPNANDTILLANYTIYSGQPWVPIFIADWDTSALVELGYDDQSLKGYPLSEVFHCGDGALLRGRSVFPFAKVEIVDVSRRRPVHIDSSNCATLLPTLVVRNYSQP